MEYTKTTLTPRAVQDLVQVLKHVLETEEASWDATVAEHGMVSEQAHSHVYNKAYSLLVADLKIKK